MRDRRRACPRAYEPAGRAGMTAVIAAGRGCCCDGGDRFTIGVRLRAAHQRGAWRPAAFLGSSTAEHPAVNRRVAGSNPARGATSLGRELATSACSSSSPASPLARREGAQSSPRSQSPSGTYICWSCEQCSPDEHPVEPECPGRRSHVTATSCHLLRRRGRFTFVDLVDAAADHRCRFHLGAR